MKIERISSLDFFLKNCDKKHQIPITIKKEDNSSEKSFYDCFLESLGTLESTQIIK